MRLGAFCSNVQGSWGFSESGGEGGGGVGEDVRGEEEVRDCEGEVVWRKSRNSKPRLSTKHK